MVSNVPKLIGVFTQDFKFFYRAREVLKSKGIPFIGISVEEEVPEKVGVLITSTSEVDDVDFQPKVACEAVEEAIGRALCILSGKAEFEWLTIGIDPGPRPGMAALGDEVMLEARTAMSPEDVAGIVNELVRIYAPRNARIRIGHGDPLNRNRIINSLLDQGHLVEIVDEKGTTRKTGNPDLEAAKQIATTRGNSVTERLPLITTARQLKEIQRQSRIASDNRITISTNLAREVAVGTITLKEALERQERSRKK
jgi:hypothetical protein